jgi:L,D-transpeptidase catalytic domain
VSPRPFFVNAVRGRHPLPLTALAVAVICASAARETPHSKIIRAAIKSRAMTSNRVSILPLLGLLLAAALSVTGVAVAQGFASVSSAPAAAPATTVTTPVATAPAAAAPTAAPATVPVADPVPAATLAANSGAFGSVSGAFSSISGGTPDVGAPVPGASPGSAGAYEMADAVLVDKGDRRLYLLKQGRVIAEYPIKLGLNPYGHKQREGDFRTPEGKYRLDWRNPNSEFYLSIRVSYPNREDAAVAHENGHRPGGLIMLHGQPNVPKKPPEHYATRDWTDGCVALSNADMTDVWLRTTVGLPIEIRP